MLSFINLAFVIRGSSDSSAVSINLCIAKFIKAYALIVLIIQVGFTSYFGAIPSREPTSADGLLRANSPVFYANLDVIGLRSMTVCAKAADPTIDLNDDNVRLELNRIALVRIVAIVCFFLISIFLANYFEKQLKTSNEKEQFGESDFKKLFEYTDAHQILKLDNAKHGPEALTKE